MLFNLNTAGTQFGQHGVIVDEIAQDGQRLVLRGFAGQRDGVANAKAHAQMFGVKDFHTTWENVASTTGEECWRDRETLPMNQ
jgi:hypothetical protein